MKSLVESLFDKDIVSKDITFGDLFRFESYNIVKNIHARGEYQDLSKSFSAGRIKKITKFSGTDKNETIYRGLVKLIQDIKLTGDPDDWGREEIQDELKKLTLDFFQYSLDNYRKIVYVGFYNHGALCLKDYSIFDHRVNEVNISLGPDLTLKFIRK